MQCACKIRDFVSNTAIIFATFFPKDAKQAILVLFVQIFGAFTFFVKVVSGRRVCNRSDIVYCAHKMRPRIRKNGAAVKN